MTAPLFHRGGLTRLQILVEIASNQPSVRQQDVASTVGISPQAVSDYFQELLAEGFVESGRRGEWRITPSGTEYVIQKARDLWHYSVKVLEDVMNEVEVYPAIAGSDLKAGQKVCLTMENGLALARPFAKDECDATGEAVGDAGEGQDVGITALRGIIPIPETDVSIIQIPSISHGGSKKCRIDLLARNLSGIVAAEGTEAIVCCRKAGREPNATFAPIDVIISAARLGLRCSLVVTDERVNVVLENIREANLDGKLIDCCEK